MIIQYTSHLTPNSVHFPLFVTSNTIVQFSALTQSCPTLCNPMDCSCQASMSITNSWVYSTPCPLSRWCYPIISSSVVPFSSWLQSFPALGSLQMNQLFAIPWTVASQASLSFTISQSLLKLMSIESVMPSNHLILCYLLLLLASIFPSIKVFSSETALDIRWSTYWSFSFSISPSREYSGLISFRIDWFDLFSVQGTPEHFL